VRWNPGRDQLAHLFAATVAFEPPPVAKSGLDVRLRSAAWLSTARSRHSNAHGRQDNPDKDQEATCEHPCRARISCKRWWSGKTARWPCDAPGPEAGGRRRTYVRTSTGAVTAAVMRSSATCNPRESRSAEPSSGIPPLRQTSVAHIANGFALWSSKLFPLHFRQASILDSASPKPVQYIEALRDRGGSTICRRRCRYGAGSRPSDGGNSRWVR
jgi:hypothetical protein